MIITGFSSRLRSSRSIEATISFDTTGSRSGSAKAITDGVAAFGGGATKAKELFSGRADGETEGIAGKTMIELFLEAPADDPTSLAAGKVTKEDVCAEGRPAKDEACAACVAQTLNKPNAMVINQRRGYSFKQSVV